MKKRLTFIKKGYIIEQWKIYLQTRPIIIHQEHGVVGFVCKFLSNKVYTNPRLNILGFLFSNVAPSVMIAHLSVKQVERVWFPGSTQVLAGVVAA